MATTLTVRGVPPALHEQLKRRAAEHRRSLNSEILILLEEAVGRSGEHERILEQMDRYRAAGPTLRDEPADLKKHMREGRA